jgi:adenylate kinase
MLALIVGSPASGKTSIIGKCKGYRGLKCIKIGDLMLECAKKSGYSGDRDGLRKLPIKETIGFQRLALKKLSTLRGSYLIDTHLSVESNGRFLLGLPKSSFGALKNVSCIIYVDAPTKEIISRRSLDKSRRREKESQLMIETQKGINLSVLSYLSWHLGIPFYLIENKNGMLEASVKRVKAIVDEF